jgi:hypothetical protein
LKEKKFYFKNMPEQMEIPQSEHEPQLEKIVSLGGQTLERELTIREPKKAGGFILSTIVAIGLSTALLNNPGTPASTKKKGKSAISGLLEKLSKKSDIAEIQVVLKNASELLKNW